jgi:hypothetical protein
MFNNLLSKGVKVDHEDYIHEYLEKRGATPEAARDIQAVYSTLEALHEGTRYWQDEFIEQIINS